MAKIIAGQVFKVCSYAGPEGECCLDGKAVFTVFYDSGTAELTGKSGKKIYACDPHSKIVEEKTIALQAEFHRRNQAISPAVNNFEK